jgi:hypothetical protein
VYQRAVSVKGAAGEEEEEALAEAARFAAERQV